MKIMRWCLPAQKTGFQLRTLNVSLGKPHIGFWALSYALHLRWEKFLLGLQGFPIISEKINCFEEMLFRKIVFKFWGLTLFKRALKCIILNKMKKSIVHYGDNVLVFANTKNSFQQRIFNVPLGKFHIWICALNYFLHLRCEEFLLGLQGYMVSHYI